MRSALIFLAGIFTGALGLLIGVSVWSAPTKEEALAEQVRKEQSRLNILCALVAETSHRVIREDVSEIIRAAQEERPWITPDHVGLIVQASQLAGETRECRRIERMAREANYPFEQFAEINDFFEMLAPTLRLYQVGTPEQTAKLKDTFSQISARHAVLITLPVAQISNNTVVSPKP